MKKIPVDIVIRYEHKVRELESIMLIRMEMERRGYSVAFTANYDYKSTIRYNPKLIVSPAIYNEDTLLSDLKEYGLKRKIVNLLWEQLIGIKDEEAIDCSHNITGAGHKAIAFCWGQRTQSRLVKAGMPVKNTKVVGQINTDFLRGPLSATIMTKDQLATKFGLNKNARWNLFVSSFSYCELDELQKELIIKLCGKKYLNEFTEISNSSREGILNWFENTLSDYPDDIFIYRPHPDEAKKSIILKNLESKYKNFFVISDLAVKHWINASDMIYNWYSTGIVDAIILNKPYRILRPIIIPKEYDYRLFYNAVHIKSLSEFKEDYPSLEIKDIVDKKLYSEYYYVPDMYVYKEICDILEDMLNTGKYDIKYTLNEKISFGMQYIMSQSIRRLSFVKPLLRKFHIFESRLNKSALIRETLKKGYQKNVASKEEIDAIYKKLKPIIYNE